MHAPARVAQQAAIYTIVLEDVVLKDEELVLEAEQRTALEAGSRERNERLRWSAAMRMMIQKRRGEQARRGRGERVEGERKRWSRRTQDSSKTRVREAAQKSRVAGKFREERAGVYGARG